MAGWTHFIPGRGILDQALEGVQALCGRPSGGSGGSTGNDSKSDWIQALLDLGRLRSLALVDGRGGGGEEEGGGGEETHLEVEVGWDLGVEVL